MQVFDGGATSARKHMPLHASTQIYTRPKTQTWSSSVRAFAAAV